MKKTDTNEIELPESDDDMLPEYEFDYTRARANRFAQDTPGGSLVVVLEPELARVFQTSERVKAILKAIATLVPQSETSFVGVREE